MPGPTFKTDSPQLSWTADGYPRSTTFDDIYYSDQDALAECEHVFLRGCQLARLWSENSLQGDSFQLGEIGFGGGLNFLMTWALWEQHKATNGAPARLHYTAVEKYPLSPTDIATLHGRWPALKPYSSRFLQRYQPLHQGLMRLRLGEDITLDLVLDDAASWLQQRADANPPIQAWFLDGFSPAHNEALWTPDLFRLMVSHSAPNTRLATYSSAGRIRRDLEAAGFDMERREGFGRKRHMLAATGLRSRTPSRSSTTPWFDFPRRSPTRRQAVVIGAGLAGCFTANALAQRGWQVELTDAAASVANGASGIPQLALRCRLFNADNPQARFFLQAYTYCLQRLNALDSGDKARVFHHCGLLQMESAMNARQGPRRESVAALYPAAIVSTEGEGHFLFPGGGWVDGPALCARLLEHPNITFRGGSHVAQIEHLNQDTKSGTWRLYDSEGSCMGESNVLVIANGFDAARLLGSNLPLQESPGQCSQIASMTELRANTRVLCADRTLFPAKDGMHTVSATYRNAEEGTEIRGEDDIRNLRALSEMLAINQARLMLRQSRVGSRCNSLDRFPLVGPVPDFEAMKKDYAELRRNARATFNSTPHYHPGLYLNTAHGSNGLCSSPLSAEYLASLIDGDSSPLDRAAMAALNPARFLIQDLKKQRSLR